MASSYLAIYLGLLNLHLRPLAGIFWGSGLDPQLRNPLVFLSGVVTTNPRNFPAGDFGVDGKHLFVGRCSDLSILAVLSLKQNTENHDGLPLNTETLSKRFPDRDSKPIKLSAGNFEGLGLEPLLSSQGFSYLTEGIVARGKRCRSAAAVLRQWSR